MNSARLWYPHRGAVSLTFDDGNPTQLDKAIPAMNERGLRGTFYLCPNREDWADRLSPWKEAATAGHEIGNHSLSHICSNNFYGTEGGLEDRTVEEIEQDILTAQQRLLQIAPNQQQWTFCYPCYCTCVGRGAGRQSYVPVVAKHFLAGRGSGEYGTGNHPHVIDLACFWGLPVERMSGFEMIGLVEELTFRGLWVVLVFHEINGRRLTVGSHELNMLLDYLARRSSEIWTAPVVEVAAKIAPYQASLRVGDGSA